MVFVSSVPRKQMTTERHTLGCAFVSYVKTSHTFRDSLGRLTGLTATLYHSERICIQQGQQGGKTQVEPEEIPFQASYALTLPRVDTQSMLLSPLAKSAVIHVQCFCPGKPIRDSAPRFLLRLIMWTPFAC